MCHDSWWEGASKVVADTAPIMTHYDAIISECDESALIPYSSTLPPPNFSFSEYHHHHYHPQAYHLTNFEQHFLLIFFVYFLFRFHHDIARPDFEVAR